LLDTTWAADGENLKEKYISAIIYSKWAETPLLLEASEFVYRNNPNAFWPFLDEASKSRLFEDDESSKQNIYFSRLKEIYLTKISINSQ
jgi:hypothetical protein